jgi:hypothetical protein
MDKPLAGQMVFVTAVLSPKQRDSARLLVNSLRAFGGPLAECPVWILEMRPETAPCADLAGAGIEVLPVMLPEALPRYYFTYKVFAWAQVEEKAAPEVRSLTWLNPECLIVQPPLLFDLNPTIGAAFRPVHIRNVGSLAGEPLDPFWQGVYRAAGFENSGYTVEAFVDAQQIRPYYNTHLFALDPALGIGRAWLECFEALVQDEAYQTAACGDELHQIFLHQAVLSALVAKRLGPERIQVLPPEYSYPLHLHQQVPAARKPLTLNRLVCPVYEEGFRFPETLGGLAVEEPLASWLREHAPQG